MALVFLMGGFVGCNSIIKEEFKDVSRQDVQYVLELDYCVLNPSSRLCRSVSVNDRNITAKPHPAKIKCQRIETNETILLNCKK